MAFTGPARNRIPRGGAVGTALRDAARFDRSAVSITGGVIAAIPVIVVLAVGSAVSTPVAGVTMGAGAMLVGVAWRVGGGRPTLATMVAVSVLMAFSTFVGAATGTVPWLHLALLVVWGYLGGLLVTLGRRTAVMGTQAIIAIVVFGRFSQPIAQAVGLAGLVLAGGAAQVTFATLVRWPPSLRIQRDSLARAFRAVAELAVAPAEASSVPAAVAIDEAQATLAAPTLFGDRAISVLRSLVTEARRVRLELNAIRTLGRRPSGGVVPSESSDLTDAGDALKAIAGVIAHPRGPLEPGLADRLPTMAPRAGTPGGLEAELERRRAALGGQLRAIVALVEPALAQPDRHFRPSRGATKPLQRARHELGELRANASLRSAAGRHALRLAVVVPATELLAEHTPLARGYWMVVAAATVLRPEFGATRRRPARRAPAAEDDPRLRRRAPATRRSPEPLAAAQPGSRGWRQDRSAARPVPTASARRSPGDIGMAEIASVLGGGGSGPFPPLRAQHQALAAGDALGEVLLGELDEIVDAVDTVGELVGLRPADP